MKRNLTFLFLAVLVLAFSDSLWAQCPEDPNDLGFCDTLHLVPWPETDTCFVISYPAPDTICINNPGERFPCFWYVSLFVTHDSNTFWWEDDETWIQDSLAAFVVPLLFWHQEGADSVIFPFESMSWNNTDINPYYPWMGQSMFRHFVDSRTGDTVYYNRMLQMVEAGKDDWDVFTDIDSHSSDGDSGHVFLSVIRMAETCQSWWEGSRILLATLTFMVYPSEDCDTIEIGLDSTFWPPVNPLSFTRYDAVKYVPRHFLPVKDTLSFSDSIPFAPAVNYGAGDFPHSVFCADLDGDSDLDLAVANDGSDSVSILKNNGDGTFEFDSNYAVGNAPQSIFCADLDGDGDLDLAVANLLSNNVSILKNNGDGSFQSTVNYEAGDSPSSVFCADLDGDGDLDLAVANKYSFNVSVLRNNGDGTFQTDLDYGAGTPVSVFCADLDGDADLDLAVANYWDDNISILKNNGDGTFQTKVDYGAGNQPVSVFCADLDGDIDLDLAVANYQSNNVSILKNDGDGTFQTKVNYGAGDSPASVFCADLDGDSDLDLAVANYQSNNVSILRNNGDGTFQTKVDYGAGEYPSSVFCADLDQDSDFDLAVANVISDSVSIFKNLTQVSANQPPWAFSLISPADGDSAVGVAILDWHTPYDPNFGDQIRYDLYVSTDPGFDPGFTVIYDSLPLSRFTDTLEINTYYWKVRAYDNWGTETWSTETWSFAVRPLSDTLWIVAFSPVDLIVTDPVGDSISLWFNTIEDATYDDTVHWNEDEFTDDLVTIPYPFVGEYQIEVIPESDPDSLDTTYSLGIRINGSAMILLADSASVPEGEPACYGYGCLPCLRGDVNYDNERNIADVVFLVNYLFGGGPAPDPIECGDVNCDEYVNVGDAIYLINYLFIDGPPPCS
jgi:6-phosphogluconolactonase (cycloisomerase 2 family)